MLYEFETTRVRCSACHTTVAATMLWATGDVCPHCGQTLHYSLPQQFGTELSLVVPHSVALVPVSYSH